MGRRILLVQVSLQPPGGGSGVAAWFLQALARDHRVTVLSWRPVDVAPIDRFFGTSLHEVAFDTLGVPHAWVTMLDRLPTRASLLRNALLMRVTRRVSSRYDVVLGVHNEADFGRRGIQYVHYPTFLRPRPDADMRWYHQSRRLLDAYYRLADRAAGLSLERVRSNLTLANSDWTARHVERLLGVTARTVYPPVVDPDPPLPWDERARRFLLVGRISREKEIERAMRILSRVRRQAPDVELTIAGTCDPEERRYRRGLVRLASSLGSWITFREDLSREALRAMMASSRYGIHGMREEHFGMAPAELVRAGALVWLGRGGGQIEIVGGEDALLYDTEEEAAEKIAAVLSNPAEERRLREHLRGRAERFAPARFVDEVRDIVATFES
jgi:glycosyltransferase involved in cell wall biosynthesis